MAGQGLASPLLHLFSHQLLAQALVLGVASLRRGSAVVAATARDTAVPVREVDLGLAPLVADAEAPRGVDGVVSDRLAAADGVAGVLLAIAREGGASTAVVGVDLSATAVVGNWVTIGVDCTDVRIGIAVVIILLVLLLIAGILFAADRIVVVLVVTDEKTRLLLFGFLALYIISYRKFPRSSCKGTSDERKDKAL